MKTAAPELAVAVQRSFDAHIHKTLATLRADGSPRISGQEASFREGELWLGMMPDSRKATDLLRDPRLALHSATVDPEMAGGDAKLAGRAEEVTDEETIDGFHASEMGYVRVLLRLANEDATLRREVNVERLEQALPRAKNPFEVF